MLKTGEAELLIAGKSAGVKMQLEKILWEIANPRQFLYTKIFYTLIHVFQTY